MVTRHKRLTELLASSLWSTRIPTNLRRCKMRSHFALSYSSLSRGEYTPSRARSKHAPAASRPCRESRETKKSTLWKRQDWGEVGCSGGK